MSATLRIATRASPLALWQAHHVRDLLQAVHPGLVVELKPMTTRGDALLAHPLAQAGGKGLFLKELEEAMAAGTADLAVHSLKDVPGELPDGFVLAAVCAAGDARDALVGPWTALAALPPGARVGTGSLRRGCQLRALRPDLRVLPLRGNVGTRLARLDGGECEALLLAAAGLERLGLDTRIAARLSPQVLLPAPGQGVLALECRAGDARTAALLAPLDEPATAARVAAERAFAAQLGGDCRTPLGAHAELDGTGLTLSGLVGAPDGSRILRDSVHGPAAEAAALGRALAQRLRAAGADALLAP